MAKFGKPLNDSNHFIYSFLIHNKQLNILTYLPHSLSGCQYDEFYNTL